MKVMRVSTSSSSSLSLAAAEEEATSNFEEEDDDDETKEVADVGDTSTFVFESDGVRAFAEVSCFFASNTAVMSLPLPLFFLQIGQQGPVCIN